MAESIEDQITDLIASLGNIVPIRSQMQEGRVRMVLPRWSNQVYWFPLGFQPCPQEGPPVILRNGIIQMAPGDFVLRRVLEKPLLFVVVFDDPIDEDERVESVYAMLPPTRQHV